MAVISKLIPSWASPCAFHVSASIWKEYHLILCPFNRVYSFRVYRVSRYNDSISTPHTSAFVHKLQSYESNIIEPVSASCFVSILFRSVVLSGRERFHRLVEPGILLTFLLPSSFFSFFLFFFFFFLLFSVYCRFKWYILGTWYICCGLTYTAVEIRPYKAV